MSATSDPDVSTASAPTGPPWATGRMLAAAARRVEREWNGHLATWDLNHASLPVLVLLGRQDHSQRELAAAVGVTEQTMSRVLERMERIGYVTRVAHSRDRRRHVISLTDAGRAVLVDAADPGPAEELATRGLTADQVVQLRELLALILDAHPVDSKHASSEQPDAPRGSGLA